MNLAEALEKLGQEYNDTSDLAYDRAFMEAKAKPGDRVLLLIHPRFGITRTAWLNFAGSNPQALIDHAGLTQHYKGNLEEGYLPFKIQFHGSTADFDQPGLCRRTA